MKRFPDFANREDELEKLLKLFGWTALGISFVFGIVGLGSLIYANYFMDSPYLNIFKEIVKKADFLEALLERIEQERDSVNQLNNDAFGKLYGDIQFVISQNQDLISLLKQLEKKMTYDDFQIINHFLRTKFSVEEDIRSFYDFKNHLLDNDLWYQEVFKSIQQTANVMHHSTSGRIHKLPPTT